MLRSGIAAIAGVLVGLGSVLTAIAAEPVELREQPGGPTRAVIALQAEGRLQPAAPPGSPEPPPVVLKVESRLAFIERVLRRDAAGNPTRAARRVEQAAVAVNAPDRPIATQVRPELALLITEIRDGAAFTYSPSGPLTRPELDIVQGPADPLLLPGLLPRKPVAVGDTWALDNGIARAFSDYDALISSSLRAKLETVDADGATVRIGGEIRGAARGGEGTVTCEGTYRFDRKAGLLTRLELKRHEVRKAGPVEPGLDFTGTLTVERAPAPLPAELADAVIQGLPADASGGLALLQFSPPDGRYQLLHDRDWHLFWDDTRLCVLKRLDRGELVAQCNLSVGPVAGPGRHQEPMQFRDDIKAALGKRFVKVLGGGEVDGIDADTYRYKLAVQGQEADRPVLWFYYLVASPEGEQLLVTYTLNADDQQRFGDQDLQMVGSLQFRAPTRPPAATTGATTTEPRR